MPLQNRVAPDGSLHAVPERGTMLGNRGGKFHRDDQTLGKRRWASERWICCELHYKNMHHDPMGKGYTSLFFLDEVTALAAGHRPCFFCRSKEAKAFLNGEKVETFDDRLHQERLSTRKDTVIPAPSLRQSKALAMAGLEKAGIHTDCPMDSRFRGNDGLGGQPDGVVVEMDGAFFARRRNKLLRWSFSGYTQAVEIMPTMQVKVLTPPSILAILRNGYQPRWHSTASQWDD